MDRRTAIKSAVAGVGLSLTGVSEVKPDDLAMIVRIKGNLTPEQRQQLTKAIKKVLGDDFKFPVLISDDTVQIEMVRR